jgi:hypothetical protein
MNPHNFRPKVSLPLKASNENIRRNIIARIARIRADQIRTESFLIPAVLNKITSNPGDNQYNLFRDT